MSRRNKKLLYVPGSFLYDSGLQLKFLSLCSIWTSSSKITSIFYYCLFPHLLSSKMMLALGPKLLARGGGEVSQRNRGLQVLSFEGVTFATILTDSHNGLHFISPFLEAYWSAEKGTQCSASKPPQWWISLESGKRDHSWKQTKLNRHADVIQRMRGSSADLHSC